MTSCRLCHSNTLTNVGRIEGYRQGSQFAILECQACRTSVTDPCESDERLYDAIYGNVGKIAGYSRYHFLADDVLRARDPLGYIANMEDSYHAVVKTLDERVMDRSRTKICEVGCGQGYLTYSLTRSGFDCTGVDISERAVTLARTRYGDHYFCGTVADFCGRNSKPDIVVATEVIEHLVNPVQFVRVMLDSLAERGFIVLTTPNKPPRSHRIWDTELPPVHLWWFTKAGLAALARQVGCTVKFFDFTGYYAANPDYERLDCHAPTERTPIFNERYEVMAAHPMPERPSRLQRHIKRLLPKSVVRTIQRVRAGVAYGGVIADANSRSIGAIFARQDH